jgi:2-phospho-L-lactate/phosphoenolpyruvate guanylyltransferase
VISVAVPVKDLLNAKQRLAGALGPAERAALARAMLRDVLTALAAAQVDAVWVVTRDAEATELARAFGATVLTEPENRGHTSAVAVAQACAVARRVRCFLTIPGDVPCVTAAEIQALVEAAAGDRACVFTPSRSGLGTNGVALAPPDVMPLTFGEPSFENHLAAARTRGLVPRVLALPGLGLDIDAPDDLTALLDAGAHTASGRLVARWRRPAGARA